MALDGSTRQTWTMSLSQQAGGGLWSPQRRTLTVGLVLTVTLVAFEALAVSTIMPIVADELGGLELYGWVFTASCSRRSSGSWSPGRSSIGVDSAFPSQPGSDCSPSAC